MKTEKQIENEIKKYLRENKAYVVKYHGNTFSTSGVPDLLVCYKGKFIGFEVKKKTGKPSDLQLAHKKQIENSGGICYIVKSLEEVKNAIKTI